ncbi:ABC transporter permease [Amnibacterium sp. CER49]|uniref:ABC transporter permease n=1 Tax=Amnibacterium sp. CER49 TaxID=3039161 RepID=UPI0024490D8A|nr:ABC transporter permease [Amnibacterium sp. CER49]MDH2445296.1 ABC transporter permease [Amnibacterium sp. CER49]
MVAQFLRLKLQLTANLFRRNPWQVVGIVIGLLYGMSITVLAVLALVGLRFAPVAVSAPIVVIGGSLTTLGFLVVPLLLGVDDTLDPRRFALFGLDRRRLALSLGVAALAGIPALVIALVALAAVVTWSSSPAAAFVALLCAPVTVVLCTLLARISAAAAGLLLNTRRSREAITAIVVVGVVLVSPVILVLGNLRYGAAGAHGAAVLATVLGWTPLGASWAAPATIAAGDAAGLLQLLEALVVVGLLWLAWEALVARTLVTPARRGRAQEFAGLGWFGRLPATPLGAVAARSLTYWARDVRYRVGVLVVPLTPVVVLLVLGFVGVPAKALALLPVPIVALFLGWLSHNDIAYDSTAIWLHVAAGVRGRDDRLGRLVPVIVVGGPLLVAGSIVCALLYGDATAAFGLIGVGGGLFLTGLGLGSVTSARLPYPVPQPGASPFQQPNSSAGVAAAVQSLLFLGQLVPVIPAIVLAALGLAGGGDGWFVASCVVGLAAGGVVLGFGLHLGARVFEHRGPEILAAALRA